MSLCVCLCLYPQYVCPENMSTFLFFFFNGALFYFSDLARQMRSGQTVSCRNCSKCSICGVQRHRSFRVLSSHTDNTIFASPFVNGSKKI